MVLLVIIKVNQFFGVPCNCVSSKSNCFLWCDGNILGLCHASCQGNQLGYNFNTEPLQWVSDIKQWNKLTMAYFSTRPLFIASCRPFWSPNGTVLHHLFTLLRWDEISMYRYTVSGYINQQGFYTIRNLLPHPWNLLSYVPSQFAIPNVSRLNSSGKINNKKIGSSEALEQKL